MIDLQDHIRNCGAVNLFDGKGAKPAGQISSQAAPKPTASKPAPSPCGWRDNGLDVPKRGKKR